LPAARGRPGFVERDGASNVVLDRGRPVFQVSPVIGSHTSSTKFPVPPVYDGARSQTIRLAIAGAELMVNGRFDHWVPVAAEGGTPEEGAVQVFFDVTGMAGPVQGDDLFAFAATEVERLGPFAYIVKGTITKGDRVEPMEAVVQTPPAHTPFVVITFAFDRQKFADIWEDLAAVVATRDDQASQIHPRAWLRPPTLATA
jgi:hypothetical protein